MQEVPGSAQELPATPEPSGAGVGWSREGETRSAPSPSLGHHFGRVAVLPPQAKLEVGQADDPAEREADRVAEAVLQPDALATSVAFTTETMLTPPLRPVSGGGAAPAAADAAPLVGPVLGAGGQPLDADSRALMEPHFGHDFSRVRVHTDARAAESARAVNALAYTVGRDVVFGEGQYLPGTTAGQWLVAHELTHVVQQGSADRRTPERPAARQAAAVENRTSAPRLQRKESWPDGPTTTRKARNHTLAEYVAWVREVDAAFANQEDAMQHLRRLYYSSFSGGGGKFDTVIQTYGAGKAPLTTAQISPDALNGLYETNAIVTPAGNQVDVSHLLAGLDVIVSGTTIKADAAEVGYGVDFAGVLTWAGDLASWFEAWLEEMAKQGIPADPGVRESLLLATANKNSSKDDLLGDMDAQVVAQRYTTRLIENFVDKALLKANLADILEAYYGQSGKSAGGVQAKETNRFSYFVMAARPGIPHIKVSDDPLKMQLAPSAKAAIYRTVKNTAQLILEGGSVMSALFGDMGVILVLSTYDLMLWKIAWYFENFLKTGLDKGDAPWPI